MIYRLKDSDENDAKACKHLLLESSYQVVEKVTLLNYYDKIRIFRCLKQLWPRTKGEASLENQNVQRIEQCWTNCDA